MFAEMSPADPKNNSQQYKTDPELASHPICNLSMDNLICLSMNWIQNLLPLKRKSLLLVIDVIPFSVKTEGTQEKIDSEN